MKKTLLILLVLICAVSVFAAKNSLNVSLIPYSEIEATGHDYEYDSIVWTDYAAKAVYKCSHDATHTENNYVSQK